MSKSVLMSIQPKWCELIISGKKTIEIRKTVPKLKTPFRAYIYCCKNELLTKSHYNGKIYLASSKRYQEALEKNGNVTLSGKVIGEIVCDRIIPISVYYSNPDSSIALKEFPYVCLTDRQIMDYLGNGKKGYGWHISNLIIYDKPKALSEFYSLCPEWEKEGFTDKCHKCPYYFKNDADMCYDCGIEGEKSLARPPQSWCYVEDLKGEKQ